MATDDSIEQKLSWKPKKGGGANFKTAQLIQDHKGLHIRNSIGLKIFGSVFIFVGAGIFLGSLFGLLGEGISIFLLLFGVIFFVAGIYTVRGRKPLHIDKGIGVYYYGHQYDYKKKYPREHQGELTDIQGIQFLEEYCESSDPDSSSYWSYEINFVFEDASRLNILDHGNHEAAWSDAETIAKYLNVPLWSQ